MTQEARNYVMEKVKEVIAAPSCCSELKEVGREWLEAAGGEHEDAATRTLIAELEEDVSLIGPTIEFFASPAADKIFGAETARKMEAHMREVQAAGGEYCDCAACTAGKAILDRKAELL